MHMSNLDLARFHGEQPALVPQWIDLACESYFVEVEQAAAA